MTPNRDSGRHFTNRDLNWDKQPPRLDDSFKLGDPILDDTGENDKTELIPEAEQRNEMPAEIMERKEFSATETYESQPFSSAKKKSKNKARFSDEQIRSLESIFETETKLEPRKKMEVAGELGLQPRQVAIWFQNKRARWKSKQIEHDLRILRANYDSLSSKFETLQEEKKVLLSQLQKLSGLLDKPRCSSTTNGDQADEKARNRLQEELEEPETEHSYEYQNNGIIRSVEDEGCEFEVTNPDEEKRNYINYVEEDGRQLWNISEQLHASLTSASFDNSCCSSEWLNFWS